MEIQKKTLKDSEGLTAFEYGLKMLILVASVTHQHDSKTVEEVARLVRRRLEGSRAVSASSP